MNLLFHHNERENNLGQVNTAIIWKCFILSKMYPPSNKLLDLLPCQHSGIFKPTAIC